jgi:hypothetical protein
MSVTLRDGSTTEDVRLDRLVEFDQRSRAFPIAAVVPKVLRSRTWPCATWLDQGQEGACVSFAWHHEAAAVPALARGLTDGTARDRYFETQRRDEWEGGAYPGASPRYDGTSVLAGAKVMQELGFFREYRWAFSVDDVLRAIAHEGPVVLGLTWLDSMYDPDADGLLRTDGREVGGHAICARGVVLPRSGVVTVALPRSGRRVRVRSDVPVVRLRNSWGADWGWEGEALIRADDLEGLLERWGECCVPVGRAVPSARP